MRFLLLIPVLICCTTLTYAQTDVDALRYSSTQPLGTARSSAMGGAMTGLGGDISALNINPAGLGQMGISEFSFSGGFSVTSSENLYLGNSSNEKKTAFQLNNLGIVYVPKKNFKKIKNISLAASYNRLANFSSRIYGNGKNTTSSLTDSYAELLTGVGADSSAALNNYPYGASLAFEGELIGMTPDRFFYSFLELPLKQQISINRKGNISEYNFGTGIAFNDQIMLGVSIGIPTINFEEELYFKETDKGDLTPDFNYWEKTDRVRTEGSGINARFGVLYLPTSNLRLGASFTTPTRYNIRDRYLTYFKSDFTQYTIDNFQAPTEGYFDYNMTTPLKFNVGATGLSEKLGLITVDYEFSNPGKTRYSFDDRQYNLKDYETQLNSGIQTKYKATHTVRAGLESRFLDYYRARVGFQYRSSAFADQSAMDDLAKNRMLAFSGGLGYRGKTFYIDATYVHTITDELIVPYTVNLAESPLLTSKYNRGNFIVSLGFKF